MKVCHNALRSNRSDWFWLPGDKQYLSASLSGVKTLLTDLGDFLLLTFVSTLEVPKYLKERMTSYAGMFYPYVQGISKSV